MILVLVVWHAETARAGTICIAPCETTGVQQVDPADLSGFATLGIDGFVLEADDQGLTINVDGDLVLHAPTGSLIGTTIDLRAGETVRFDDSGISIETSGDLSLCALSVCAPFASDIPNFSADPFHLVVLAPLAGPLEVFAGGGILLTTAPIPEPGTGLLVALGLTALARRQRRA
ncbi:MAG: PEP-CTERM sorting domain-containing protein [bacterium]|nr:PEP-CTERM sorting domain-containing protein [bacterium]